MATRRIISLVLAAAVTGGIAGCTSGWGWGAGRQSTASGSSLVSTQTQPSLGRSIASGFKATGDKVVSAFTFKQKVVEADDPIKLTSKQEPIGVEVYLSAAQLYENRGDFDAAAAQYHKALEASPKSLAALISYARLHDRQDNFDEAAKLYRQAISAHPKSAMPLNDLGLCQARNSQPESALESLSKAVQLEPANKLYRNNMAAVLVDLGRSTEAFEQLAQAHGEAIAHYNLGYLLYKRDKLEPAAEQFSLALEKDPTLAQAREMLSRIGGVASREVSPDTEQQGNPAAYVEEIPRNLPTQAPRRSAAFAPATFPSAGNFPPRSHGGLERFPSSAEGSVSSFAAE